MVGVLATAGWGGEEGVIAGNFSQLGVQALAAIAAIAYSGIASFLLLKAIGAVVPLRVSSTDEARGLDVPMHGEEASTSGEGAILLRPELTESRDRSIPLRKEVIA